MISDRIYNWARNQPNKIALVYNGTPISYAGFAHAIEVARVFFRQRNFPAGKTAVVIIDNHADAWINVLALRSLGLTTICVRSIAAAREIGVGNVFCLVMTQAVANAHKRRGEPPPQAPLIVVPSEGYAGVTGDDIPGPPQDAHQPGGHLLYTSGTTGVYKKVMQSGEDEDFMLERLSRIRGITPNDVFNGLNFPLWTAAGFRSPAVRWYAGSTVMLDQRLDMLHRVLEPEVKNTFLIVPMLITLLNEHAGKPARKEVLEISMGAGFIPLSLAARAKREFNAEITNIYASTECPEVLRSTFRDKEDLYWLEPASDRTIEIADEAGSAVGVGEEGELRIELMRGDATCYHDDPEASARFFAKVIFIPAISRSAGRTDAYASWDALPT